MVIAWKWAVATWHQGKIYIMSEWYICKWGAESEYEQMGLSMNLCVVSGRAWLYRHAYRVPDE